MKNSSSDVSRGIIIQNIDVFSSSVLTSWLLITSFSNDSLFCVNINSWSFSQRQTPNVVVPFLRLCLSILFSHKQVLISNHYHAHQHYGTHFELNFPLYHSTLPHLQFSSIFLADFWSAEKISQLIFCCFYYKPKIVSISIQNKAHTTDR